MSRRGVWYAKLTDPNIAGEITWSAETLADIRRETLSATGRWHRLPGTTGDVLLHNPRVEVTHADSIIESPDYTFVFNNRGLLIRKVGPY